MPVDYAIHSNILYTHKCSHTLKCIHCTYINHHHHHHPKKGVGEGKGGERESVHINCVARLKKRM